MGLVRTLSQLERARAATADAEANAAQAEEKALDAELRSVNEQVGVAVAGGAAGGGGAGWADPVPTPQLLTSQVWRTMPAKRRVSVLGFYGHAPGRPYACFSNFGAVPSLFLGAFVLPFGRSLVSFGLTFGESSGSRGAGRGTV